MTIETENSKEQIKDIVSQCIRCGLCRELCPVLQALREEEYSPRGKAIILQNHIFEKIVYECTLCKACQKQCPLSIDLCKAFILSRQILVSQRREFSANKQMIENLEKTGNIFGIENENGKK